MKSNGIERSKYRLTIDLLALDIRNGNIAPGSEFLTRSELCAKFGLSSVTAHKVQKGLSDLGLLIPRPGKGFIVNAVNFAISSKPVLLKKVRMIGDVNALSAGRPFGSELVQSVQAECGRLGLEFELEFVHVLENPPGYLNTGRSLLPDEGLIVMLHHDLAPEIITLLLDANVRVVVVNNVFPFRSSVLTDNAHGIAELLKNAVSRGAKRILMASRFGLLPAPCTDSERVEAFLRIAETMDITVETDQSGNFHILTESVGRFKPDTVMFTNDRAALHFKNFFLEKCPGKLRILGFDDIVEEESGLDQLTTYHVDVDSMGREAVHCLFGDASILSKPCYKRVKGYLIERD